MICLDNTDTLEGGASVNNVVDYTVHGLVAGEFVNLAQGQLSSSNPSVLYTAAAAISIVSVVFVNTHSAAVTVDLYLDPANAGTPRRLIPKTMSLGIGYSLHFDGARCTILDANGNLATSQALHAALHKAGGSDDLLSAPGAIGGTTPAAGAFTTLAASGNVTPALLTASKPVFTDGSKNLVSTGTMPIDQGGTGQITAALAFDALKQAASESATGVVELDTVAEVEAGTDTTRATTAQGVHQKLANVKNPLAFSQAVKLTASSTVGGIAVADNDNIDFGTGNFSDSLILSLPDWTPSAEVILRQKHDGTNGIKFSVQTNGKLRLTINTTNYDSTVAPTVTDGAAACPGYSCTRETAIAAGSIIFTFNGVQLGDAVAITAGAPTTVNNAVSAYTMGTATTRYEGVVYVAGRPYNRAMTAAGMLSLYRNGVDFADKWGSRTSLNVSTIINSAGFPYTTFVNETATGFDATSDGSATDIAYTPVEIVVELGRTYGVSFDFVLNSGTAPVTRLLTNPAAAGGDVGGDNELATAGANAYTVLITTAGTCGLMFKNQSTTTDFEVTNISVKQTGATLDLEPEGIQPAPGQWLDASSNKLHAMQPATGSSLVRPKRDFEKRWTNTWAGTHEAQYIGGVNQAILPVGCYITSIIGVISGATIEDIIVGDGSDTDRWVTITTGLAAGTVPFTIANAISDGTNYKMVVDPDANFTGSIAWTIRGIILQ